MLAGDGGTLTGGELDTSLGAIGTADGRRGESVSGGLGVEEGE